MYPRSPPPSALYGFHPLQGPDRSMGDFELYTFPGGIPSRNAATSVNGLNADPVWRRPQYPWAPQPGSPDTRSWWVVAKCRPETRTWTAPVPGRTVATAAC